jgi:hypothetical protein
VNASRNTPWLAVMSTTDCFRPRRSLRVPQTSRPVPLARLKNTAIAVPATALASASPIPLSVSASMGYSFMRPMAIRPAPALTAKVSEMRWNCGVRSISREVNASPPAPAAGGGWV